MWKALSSLLAFNLLILTSMAQLELVLVDSFKCEGSIVESDGLGHLYVVDGSTLKKYNTKGENLKQNSLSQYGEITAIDMSNALKYVVFFGDFQQVLFLDNELAERGTLLRLDQFANLFASQVANSYNNGLWVYDNQASELSRLDERFQVSNTSGNLLQQLRTTPTASKIIEYNNTLFMLDTNYGIRIFNRFAIHQKNFPIGKFIDFSPSKKGIFLLQENNIWYMDYISLQLTKLIDFKEDALSFSVINKKYFVLSNSGMKSYELRFTD